MHRASGIPLNDDGSVTFTTRYVQSASGYRGRVYAQGVALSKVPRRLRKIAYDGMGARDWDVAMAYFIFETQNVDKLGIQIASPYFNMNTIRIYIRDKHSVRGSAKEKSHLGDDECKQLRNAVFDGEREGRRCIYVEQIYRKHIAGWATYELDCESFGVWRLR